jgi:hypothetical protein
MTIARWLIVPLLGFGVSLVFTPACGSSGLSCANPTSADTTCLTCLNSSCASLISTLASDCPGFSCAEECNCGDTSCITKCENGDAGAACLQPGDAVLQCADMMCASQCAGALIL